MSAEAPARARMRSPDRINDTSSGGESPAQNIARRLINSGRSESRGANTPARAAASASDHLYRELSRWVGPDGCHALFMRALAETRPEHPALEQIQLRARSDPYVEGLAETIIARGDPATAEALEWMLVRLVELLSRLIGEAMAMKLFERGLARSERRDGATGDEREEA